MIIATGFVYLALFFPILSDLSLFATFHLGFFWSALSFFSGLISSIYYRYCRKTLPFHHVLEVLRVPLASSFLAEKSSKLPPFRGRPVIAQWLFITGPILLKASLRK